MHDTAILGQQASPCQALALVLAILFSIFGVLVGKEGVA